MQSVIPHTSSAWTRWRGPTSSSTQHAWRPSIAWHFDVQCRIPSSKIQSRSKFHPTTPWLGQLCIAAVEPGRGLEFALEVSSLLWDGTTENWPEGAHVAQAAHRIGLDLNELQSVVTANPEYHAQTLAANDRALHAVGHWGVPTMVFNGEPFFGQDRFDMLVQRLEQNGCQWKDGE